MSAYSQQRQHLWPKGKMPDAQSTQIGAMFKDAQAPGFKPEKNHEPFLEWFDAPSDDVRNGSCMILISGGSYEVLYDSNLIELWNKELTARGVQCVNLVYRTPRPEGLPIYKSAWEDGQRAVRLVRNEAKKRGFDPEKIGVISMSAGSHLALLLATSSQTPAYDRIDALDDIPCHINWAIVNAPAYVTTDGEIGDTAEFGGFGVDVKISDVFKFDSKTCPMSLHHGAADDYTPNGSTLVYRELRKMGIPSELHIYPDKGHGAYGLERGIEFMNQMGFMGELSPSVPLMQRYSSDDSRAEVIRQDVWPEGKTPNFQEHQCVPYIEWHFPKEKKTDAIQIIYSGGAYWGNDPDGFEVTPVRRYLNDRGMTVVTLKYRTPKPNGLSKHVTAWEDLQRAIRLVRSQAKERGLDPDRIGIMGSSAGGHLTLMGVTSSRQQSYRPIDAIDRLSCKVQWGVAIYPAYVLSDGFEGENALKGNGEDLTMAPEFNFDIDTAPTIFIQGDSDPYSAMGSVRVWEKMRAMGVQSELHTLATRIHCFNAEASEGTGSYTYIDRIWDFLTEKGFNR